MFWCCANIENVCSSRDIEFVEGPRKFLQAPPAAQRFGNAGREHMEKYGSTAEQFAKIAFKNHRSSVHNLYSQFRDEYTFEQVIIAPSVNAPVTKLQCCPTSDGAACVILASEAFVKAHGLEGQAVEITGMSMATDMPSTLEDKSCIKMVGFDTTRRAADTALKKAGKIADAVQVVELHDCVSANELLTYEALGLCPEGKAGSCIDNGYNRQGGASATANAEDNGEGGGEAAAHHNKRRRHNTTLDAGAGHQRNDETRTPWRVRM